MHQAGFIIGRLLTGAMLVVLFLAGLLYSRTASEGETLYPLRVLGEEIEYALIPNKAGKINFKLEQLNNSILHGRKEAHQGQLDQIVDNSEQFISDIAGLQEEIGALEEAGQDTSELELSLTVVGETQLCALEDALKAASEEKQAAMQEQIDKLLSILNDSS